MKKEILEAKEILDEKSEELKDLFRKDKNEGLEAIANHIVNKYSIKTFDENDIYIFIDGIYCSNSAVITIKKEAKEILGSFLTSHSLREIIEKVKIETSEIGLTKDSFATSNTDLICVENGILNLKTRELKAHNPAIPFLSKIPVRYDKEATCSDIKKFFSEVFEEEDVPVIQEWIGYCLLRNYKYKKAMLLEAPYSSGKTQLLNILQNFIGKNNVSGVGLQEFYQKFAVVSLFGMHLNSYDDLSFRDLKETGKFKMATGGGELPASYKFQNEFHFSNFAKLIFATNQIPKIDFDDDAYYARWLIIRLPSLFRGKDKVPDIGNKISTPEELSGLLNYALDGLDRLQENESFSYERSMEEVKAIMQRSGSTLMAFIDDEILEGEDEDYITKKEFYEAYTEYCSVKGIWKMTKNKVGRDLSKNTTFIRDGQAMSGGRHNRAWKKAKFREFKNIKENKLV